MITARPGGDRKQVDPLVAEIADRAAAKKIAAMKRYSQPGKESPAPEPAALEACTVHADCAAEGKRAAEVPSEAEDRAKRARASSSAPESVASPYRPEQEGGYEPAPATRPLSSDERLRALARGSSWGKRRQGAAAGEAEAGCLAGVLAAARGYVPDELMARCDVARAGSGAAGAGAGGAAGGFVLYIMFAALRASDNPALDVCPARPAVRREQSQGWGVHR